MKGSTRERHLRPARALLKDVPVLLQRFAEARKDDPVMSGMLGRLAGADQPAAVLSRASREPTLRMIFTHSVSIDLIIGAFCIDLVVRVFFR